MLPTLLNNKKNQGRGFSLVETVIYVALVIVLMVAVTGSLLAISKTSRELSAWRSLQAEGSAVMDRLSREIRVATSTPAGGVFDQSPGRLALQSAGLDGNASGATIISTDASDNLTLKVGSDATTTLTSNTEVRSLTFRNITVDTFQAIRIELQLGTKPGLVDKSFWLFNTVVLRSSYGE